MAGVLASLSLKMKITAIEARKKFGMLLDRVETGEEIVITRHGKAVARLMPNVDGKDRVRALAALIRIRERAKSTKQRFDWETLKGDRYSDLVASD